MSTLDQVNARPEPFNRAQGYVNAWGSTSKNEVRWNPFNFVVQRHSDGAILFLCTGIARTLLGLPEWRGHNKDYIDIGRKPIELTMDNVRRANPRMFESEFVSAMRKAHAELNARLEASRHEVRQQIICDCAIGNPEREERNKRIMATYNDGGTKPYTKEQLAGAFCRPSDDCVELSLYGYQMMGVDLADAPASTICQTVIGIVPEHRRRMIPVLLRRESEFVQAMRQNYAAMNARHAAQAEIGRQLLEDFVAVFGRAMEEKIWRDAMNRLSLTSLWRE